MLFDRFHFCDLAIKAVGVGSVGTFCAIGLFLAADDDPIFLQVKEAKASVLEPYVGKSLHQNHGQRVVVGQRLMQSASDIFLGWARGLNGRDVYIRQLRDMKISCDRRRLGFRYVADIHENVCVGSRAGACPLWRCRHDFRLHGFERNL